MSGTPELGGRHLKTWRAVVAGLVVLAASLPAGLARAAAPCCFANDRYEGTCTVAPGKGETCESILAYLNNPMSAGKTYCGGTIVRSGWVTVSCTTPKPAGQPRSATSATSTPLPVPARSEDPTGRTAAQNGNAR
jgi:hypothetical protein